MKEKEMSLDDIKSLNIYEKLSKITEELGIVEKNLNVSTGKNGSYKAVSERDILDNVKPLEVKYRIYSYPKDREIVEQDRLITTSQYGEKQSLYLRIKTTYEFINMDKPDERITTITYSDGIDTGDKATGKASTYGDKYALMKMYKISTGEDPDKDASPEQGYKKDLASKEQIDKINSLLAPERLKNMLTYYKISKIEQLSETQAEELIRKLSND